LEYWRCCCCWLEVYFIFCFHVRNLDPSLGRDIFTRLKPERDSYKEFSRYLGYRTHPVNYVFKP
jgi:hypothetical protein